jgi:FtsP/CotA-like multicopper oxidase with cupredoxin domain
MNSDRPSAAAATWPRFKVVATGGNPVPHPVEVPVLWIGTAERISAVAEMNHPRVFATSAKAAEPDHVVDMVFAKQNAADGGFNRWTINGAAYPDGMRMTEPMLRLSLGRRYRLRMRSESDDIHPIHLHRHSFEVTRIGGKPTSGIIKDVIMLAGYQEAEIDFVADNPGMTLFHCHQQMHMGFGVMAVFSYEKNRLKPGLKNSCRDLRDRFNSGYKHGPAPERTALSAGRTSGRERAVPYPAAAH